MSLLKRCKYIFLNSSSINCLTNFSVSSLKHNPQKDLHTWNAWWSQQLNTWGVTQQRGLPWQGTAKIPGGSLQDYWNGSCMSHVGENTGHSKWPKFNLSYPNMHWNEVTVISGVILDFYPDTWCCPEQQPAQGDKHQPPRDKCSPPDTSDLLYNSSHNFFFFFFQHWDEENIVCKKGFSRSEWCWTLKEKVIWEND